MHADGKSTLVSVSKWNSGKVNLTYEISIQINIVPIQDRSLFALLASPFVSKTSTSLVLLNFVPFR